MRHIVAAFLDRLPSHDFEKLFAPSYTAAMARILFAMTASFFLFGFFYPYWRYADQDLILAYQGLLLNDGRPQDYFDHTGYLYDLAIAGWYRLDHWLGILPIHALSELPPSADAGAFDAAWQGLVEAGRVLSLIFAGLFVWIFTASIRRLVGDWRIAVLAGLALAFSGSFAMHMRIMRTELLSAGLFTTALLGVLLAGKEHVRDERRAMLLAIAGLCSTLAVVTKVQALFPVLAIPVIALAFGQRPTTAAEHRKAYVEWRWWAVPLALAALASAVPATALFIRGLADTTKSIFPYQSLGILPAGAYQALIALAVVSAMIAYAVIWRVGVLATLTSMAAVLLGVSLGLLSLELVFHEQNLLAVTHPIEHMFVFASWSSSDLAHQPQVLSETLFGMLLRGFATVMAAHTFVLHTTPRPTLLLEWLTIGGAVVLWRRGERVLPLQIALLLLVAWGLDTVFTLRGLKLEYFVYTDPLLIIAAALVAVRFADLRHSARVQKVGVCLFAVYIVWAHLEPVKPLLGHGDPAQSCGWIPTYLKAVDPFPFCRL
jgi:hypothetical protein